MEKAKMTLEQCLKTLKIIHIALIFGVFVSGFIIIELFQIGGEVRLAGEENLVSIIIMLLLSFAAIFWSHSMFKKELKSIRKESDSEKKMTGYIRIFITKLSILEGSAIIGVLLFSITNDYVLLALVLILVIIMVFNAPSRSKLRDHLIL